MKIAHSRLLQVIHYDPITGLFAWKNRTKGIKPGARPGNMMKKGYIRIFIDGRSYQANVLAWFYTTGKWPTGDVDHRNGERADNRMENLRDVSRMINLQNSTVPKATSTIGLRGVQRNHSRFMARIQSAGRSQYIGTYDTPEQAHAAYLEAKKAVHPEWVDA